jgi:hypothetical protein
MASSGIPADVEQFIQTHIDSVELMEVLLYLEKNNFRDLSAAAIATALYSNADSISLRLRKLKAAGLVDVVEDEELLYHYSPDSPDKDAMVKKLAKVYQERRVAVITAILARQAHSIHAFSDAFLFGKRKDS